MIILQGITIDFTDPFPIVICGVLLYIIYDYVRTKAKNKALIEDIGKLTTAQKQAEKPFSDDSEEMKSRLKIKEGKEIGLHADEKNAISELHANFFNWFNSCIDISLGGVNIRTFPELKKYLKVMSENHDKVHNSIMKFNLFITDDELKMTAMSMINAVNDNVRDILPKYINGIIDLEEDYAKNGYTGRFDDKLSPLRNRTTEEIREKMKKVIPFSKKFESDSREYLKGK